jgi:hypothetical protein
MRIVLTAQREWRNFYWILEAWTAEPQAWRGCVDCLKHMEFQDIWDALLAGKIPWKLCIFQTEVWMHCEANHQCHLLDDGWHPLLYPAYHLGVLLCFGTGFCSDITGGMRCKNGELDVWEILDISGGTECNDGQRGVWEIRLAIRRSHTQLLRKPR